MHARHINMLLHSYTLASEQVNIIELIELRTLMRCPLEFFLNDKLNTYLKISEMSQTKCKITDC